MSYFRFDPRTGMPVHEDLLRMLKSWPEGASRHPDEESNVVTSHWMPPVDIEEAEDGFVIRADLPGVAPESIEISMADGVLTLRGERAPEASVRPAGLRRAERPHGSFYRRFSLPDGVDAAGISARADQGVLTVTIPRRSAANPRRIVVDG